MVYIYDALHTYALKTNDHTAHLFAEYVLCNDPMFEELAHKSEFQNIVKKALHKHVPTVVSDCGDAYFNLVLTAFQKYVPDFTS